MKFLLFLQAIAKKNKKEEKKKRRSRAGTFFASFLGSKKEVGSGAKPQCYMIINEELSINLVRNHLKRSGRSLCFGCRELVNVLARENQYRGKSLLKIWCVKHLFASVNSAKPTSAASRKAPLCGGNFRSAEISASPRRLGSNRCRDVFS